MPKKKTTAGTTKTKSTRKTGREAVIDKLRRINHTLGELLTPRFSTLGITEQLTLAQATVLRASESIPADWKPIVGRQRNMNAEQLKKLEERIKRDQVRLEQARAQLVMSVEVTTSVEPGQEELNPCAP